MLVPTPAAVAADRPEPRTTGPGEVRGDPFAALRAIERKLERWELTYLREHAAHLATQAEQLEAQLQVLQQRLSHAEDVADYWREQVLQMQEDLADDTVIGLTADGRLGLLNVNPGGQ